MHYLGIEIGGTKLQLGVGSGAGTLDALWRGPVEPALGAEGIRRQIEAAVPELLSKAGLARSSLKGIGIGFGGPVDDTTKTVIRSHQIEGWDEFPLSDWISELVGLPAALGNDADVAALAEALFGAGKGTSPVLYITVGSGIGGGLVIDGEIYRGRGRGAVEIGHLWVQPKTAMRTAFPERQMMWLAPHFDTTLERSSSGWGIQEQARALMLHHPNCGTLLRTLSPAPEAITATHIAQAAGKGDVVALYVWDVALACLAQAISQAITLLSPSCIVIGGGVSLAGEQLFYEPLRRMVANQVFEPFAGCYEIVPAALGEEVVVHGALALVRRRLDSQQSEPRT
jgi:glucokinase